MSSGHVDMAAERRASSRATVAGSSSTPAVPDQVDDAGELGDGQAMQLAAVPLDGVLDAPAGDLERVEGILGVGIMGLPQGLGRTGRRRG